MILASAVNRLKFHTKTWNSFYLFTLIFINCMRFSYESENIILILADDLDSEIDGMNPMYYTQKLIGEKGATFTNCFVASPICCPNRASILTGRYQHNHLTVNNSISGGCNSAQWRKHMEPNSFAAHLKNEMGYTTFYAGKYLNQYGNEQAGGISHVPVGWDWWAGLVGNSKYYNYSLSINGSEETFGDEPQEYLTDVITDLATNFIKSQGSLAQPFLMVLSPPAPHAPFTPANRHSEKFKSAKAKRTPNFNSLPEKDKHWLLRRGPSPLPDNLLPKLDQVFRKRWQTLLAVDELVLNINDVLESMNILNRTYLMFTSDNGYHIGQFSLPIDKRQPYETDIKVPLLISGPGIPSSVKITAPVSSVDIFSTILEIAGLESPSDGTSLLKTALPEERTLLIEYRGERFENKILSECPNDSDPNLSHCDQDMACKCQDVGNNTYSCVRRISRYENDIFCVFEDDEFYIEAYNINKDPYQMNNIGYTLKPEHRHKFRKRLKKMVVCENEGCIVTGTQRIQMKL